MASKSDGPKVVRMYAANGAQVTVAEDTVEQLKLAGFSTSKPSSK